MVEGNKDFDRDRERDVNVMSHPHAINVVISVIIIYN